MRSSRYDINFLSFFLYDSVLSRRRWAAHTKGGNRAPLGGTDGQRRESKRAAPVLTGDAASAVPWRTPASLKHTAGWSDAVPAAPNSRGVLAASQRRSKQILPALRIALLNSQEK